MMEPLSQGVMSCPICHNTLRLTAHYCPKCHAEKHFGPLRREIILSCVIGMILASSVSVLLISPSLWTALIALGGFCLGFAFAQYRFNTDRWIRPRSTHHF